MSNDSRNLLCSGITLNADLAEAFEISGALIIQQLHYWLTGQPHMRDGKPWIWNTYDDWQQDIRVFGSATIRTKIKELEVLGIIVVGNYNKVKYDRTRWYTMDYSALAKHLRERLPKCKISAVPSAKFWQIKVLPISRPIPETTTETNPETSLQDPSGLPVKTKLKIPIPSGKESIDLIEEPPMAKAPTNSASVLLNMHKAQSDPSPAKKGNTSASCQSLWQRLVPKHHPSVGMLPAFTQVQKGKFSQLVRKLGPKTDQTLEYVAVKWIGYSKFVASEVGLKTTPNVPDIGFLLKYAGEAASYTQSALQLTAPAHKPKAILSTTEPVTHPDPEPAEVAEGEEQVSIDTILNWKPSDD